MQINIEKRHLGYFCLFLVLVGSLVVLATVPNPGHPLDDIEGWDTICTIENSGDGNCADDVGDGGGESIWSSLGDDIYYNIGKVAIGHTLITGSYDLYVEERAIFNGIIEARDSVRITNFPETLPACDSSIRGMMMIREYHENQDSDSYRDEVYYCQAVYYQADGVHQYSWQLLSDG